MELRVLGYFIAVAEEQGILKAAERLHITQPTLSRQLAQLEEETGAVLFERNAHGITLTEEGLLLYRRAKEITELAQHTLEDLKNHDVELSGTISIDTGELANTRTVASLCRDFRLMHPHVHFRIDAGDADTIKERISTGLLDLGLLLEPVDTKDYDYIRLPLPEPWAVMVKTDHPLAEKTYITKEDLVSQPLVMPGRPEIQGELANWFGREVSSLNVTVTTRLASMAAVFVLEGNGCALVIEGFKPLWNPQEIVLRRFRPELSSRAVLAVKRSQPQSTAVKTFMAYVKKRYANEA